MTASEQAADVVGIASDHAGVALKATLVAMLHDLGMEVLDLGTDGPDSVDYPDFADALAGAMTDGRAGRGILICGTGIGIAMAANRHRNIRAATCHDTTDARLARLHNDANVLCLGGRLLAPQLALELLDAWLACWLGLLAGLAGLAQI